MELVTGMQIFVRAAELRSFTRAAKSLGVTASGVGKAIQRLESELDVRLLHRTTRNVALTDEGALFLEHCRRVLDEVEAARSSIAARRDQARGRLRVSMPRFVGLQVVIPALAPFVEVHREVDLDIDLNDRRVNLVEDGFDLVLRVGDSHDSGLISRRVGWVDIVTVAAPAFLAKHPIASLGDLALAPSVAFRVPTTGRERPWSYEVNGRKAEWSPRARVIVSDGDGLVQAALAGLGVTQVPEWMARASLASGMLVEVLASQRPPPLPVRAMHLHQRLPPRTKAFLAFLASLPAWKQKPRHHNQTVI